MNVFQIYLIGCFLAYPIGIYILKAIKESNSKGVLEQSQMILNEFNIRKTIKFYHNLAMSMMVVSSWLIVVLWSYLFLKSLLYTIKYYLFRK